MSVFPFFTGLLGSFSSSGHSRTSMGPFVLVRCMDKLYRERTGTRIRTTMHINVLLITNMCTHQMEEFMHVAMYLKYDQFSAMISQTDRATQKSLLKAKLKLTVPN